MLASLLRRHPHARGILVDLPGAVARAGEIIESFGVGDRVTAEGRASSARCPPAPTSTC